MSLAKWIRAHRRYLQTKYRDVFHRRRLMEAVFTNIYAHNSWGDEESGSGPGSNLIRTRKLREELPRLLKTLGATSLLDAACGDFNWMRLVDPGVDRYIGIDVVPDVIARNHKLYESEKRQFLLLDITTDNLPDVDVILCRDCFIHLSFQDIDRALKNFKRSKSKYLLTNTYLDWPKNVDVVTGGFRQLNLQLPPFNLPPPIALLAEKFAEEQELFYKKSLGLWKLRDL